MFSFLHGCGWNSINSSNYRVRIVSMCELLHAGSEGRGRSVRPHCGGHGGNFIILWREVSTTSARGISFLFESVPPPARNRGPKGNKREVKPSPREQLFFARGVPLKIHLRCTSPLGTYVPMSKKNECRTPVLLSLGTYL